MRCLGQDMALRTSVYRKQRRFVERLDPCVRTNRFLAIGSRSSNDVVHRTQKDCYGRRQTKKTGRERSQAVERALFRWTRARRIGWCPFRGVTKAGGVRRKGPNTDQGLELATTSVPTRSCGTHRLCCIGHGSCVQSR